MKLDVLCSLFMLQGITLSHSYTFNKIHYNNNYNSPTERSLDQIIRELSRKSAKDPKFYGYSKRYHIDSLRRIRSQESESDEFEYKEGDLIPLIKNRKKPPFPSFPKRNNQHQQHLLKRKFQEDFDDFESRREEERNTFPDSHFDDNNDGGFADGSEEDDDDDDDVAKSFMGRSGIGGRSMNANKIPSAKRERDADKRDDEECIHSGNFDVFKYQKTNFNDVGGYDTVKHELLQTVEVLRDIDKYKKFNIRTPKGLVLEGPPGNGKTLLAKSLAGEIGVNFIPVSGSQFQEQYVGVGAARVREVFRLAKKHQPCIVFIDEVDAVGRHRSSSDGSGAERDSTLNELLVALDGFKDNKGVFVMCATNRYDLLDAALIRPGRIDKRIFLGNPDTMTRRSILQIHMRGKIMDSSVDVETLVKLTRGLSGAQIEGVLNEAMLLALREQREIMELRDVETAITRILVGWQPVEHEFSPDMLLRICVHEMGHFLLGICAKNHPKVENVRINLYSPRSPGYTTFEQGKNVNIFKKEELADHLMILLGGRIAEEIVYGNSVTTGASNDIEEAFRTAHNMVEKYGMSSGKNSIYLSYMSEKYKQEVDREVISLLEEAAQRAFENLSDRRETLVECAKLLLEKRFLVPQQLEKLLEV